MPAENPITKYNCFRQRSANKPPKAVEKNVTVARRIAVMGIQRIKRTVVSLEFIGTGLSAKQCSPVTLGVCGIIQWTYATMSVARTQHRAQSVDLSSSRSVTPNDINQFSA